MAETGRTRSLVTDGTRLRVLRYSAGLTVDQVVQKMTQELQVKIHTDHLRRIERGARNGSPKVLHALARVYDTDVSDLLVTQ